MRKKWLFTISVLLSSVMTITSSSPTSRTPLSQKEISRTESSKDVNLAQRFFEKSKNFQKRETSSKSGFQSVLPLNLQKANITTNPGALNVKVNGAVVYDINKDYNQFGIYSFTANAPIKRETVQLIPRLSANGGAIYTNGKFYIFDYSITSGYVNNSTYITYDAKTWAEVARKNTGYDVAETYSNVALSCAQDPISGTVYTCSYAYNATTKEIHYVLSTWDLEGMTKTTIAPLERPMQVMGCTTDGTLYGISSNTASGSNNGGILYRIDKTTGALTEIGDTGVDPKYFQSAIVDIKKDIFYWFANEEDESANLYTVNLTTGAASLIGALPYAEQVVGAYIPAPEANDGAPSGALNLAASFEGGSLSGQVSFDTPTYTYDGTTLTGELTYKVVGNDVVLATGTTQTGTAVSAPVVVSSSGTYKLEVILTNSIGDSPASKLVLYIGKDVPLAVNQLTVVRDGNINTLNWSAPTGSENGGYMDVSKLHYKVVRMPDNITVAENISGMSFSETFVAQQLALYYYVVTPYNDNVEGKSALSNSIKIGDALIPPYEQPFKDAASIDLFTIIDANSDKSTWSYFSGVVRYRYNAKNAANDWLITPPLRLAKGNVYEFSFDTYVLNSRSAEKLEVKMGVDASAVAMTTDIMTAKEYTNTSSSPKRETFSITPEADGIYYIGFHAVSDANKGNLTIDNVKIGAPVLLAVPGEVTKLTVTRADKGALSATVAFTAPILNAKGEALAEITSIEVKRGKNVIKKFESPSVGSNLEFEDTEAVAGLNTYSVIAYNSFGPGVETSATEFIGHDAPATLGNVVFTDNGNGSGQLSWSQVSEAGVNGGFVDPATVKYMIYGTDSKLIADNVTGTQYALSNLNNEKPQVLTYFMVKAKNDLGTSATAATSNSRLVGPAYGMPYMESFAEAKISNGPWVSEFLSGKKSDSEWAIRPDQSQDKDGGSADFCGYSTTGSCRISSPKINISGIKNPRLNAWVLMPTGGTRVKFQISVNYGEWQDLTTIESAERWTHINLDLNAYKTGEIRIAFVGECLKAYNFAYVDNVEIRSYYDNNLKATNISGPPSIKFKEEGRYIVSVFNDGVNSASNFSVSLSDAKNNIIETKSVEILPSQKSTDIEFSYTPAIELADSTICFNGVVNFASDENVPDNKTANISTEVKGFIYPIVTDLAGEINGSGITLNWSSPDLSAPLVQEIKDDFEDYTPFTINGFGNWTVFDADGGETFVFGEANGWPNAGQPQAFMIFDMNSPFIAGIGVEKNFKMDDSHGSKLAICWAANPTTTKAGHNDDWLISDRLAECQQVISFQALSYSDLYNPESMEVYYSTTGNTTDCFTNKLGEVASVPSAAWSTYTYNLPENATYFAIRCTSKEAFMLGIDNAIYSPQPVLPDNIAIESYNVYRDGILIANTAAPGYIDGNAVADTPHSYRVSVVYNLGESNASAALSLMLSGITTNNDAQTIDVYDGNKSIMIRGAQGSKATLYNTIGVEVFNDVCSDVMRIPAASGIYIVKVGEKIAKIIVK